MIEERNASNIWPKTLVRSNFLIISEHFLICCLFASNRVNFLHNQDSIDSGGAKLKKMRIYPGGETNAMLRIPTLVSCVSRQTHATFL